MAKRPFRTEDSIRSERSTRDSVKPFLRRCGFQEIREERVERGSAITQVIEARRGSDRRIRMHVRLCWRRDGRHPREHLYSAAQLRARLIDGDWDATLKAIASRERADGNTHMLLLQKGKRGFELAALIPCDRLPAIWARQRAVSADLIARGLAGRVRKNHAENGASPTIWLQDDRTSEGHAVADVLWNWPGVVNLLSQPKKAPAKTGRPPIVYFNIGWMKHYAGADPNDRTIGAHGYLDRHKHGAESFNFLTLKGGTVRGYRPPGNRERINIGRMGASAREPSIGGALVIWLAKEPDSRRTMIVGWYRNATVFRDARDGGIDLNGERIHYSVETRSADATLLGPLARTFEVRSRRRAGAGFGQKPTWYGAEAVDAKVWAYVRSQDEPRKSAGRQGTKRPPRNLDPELRRRVESAAVDHAIAYYRSQHGNTCRIESVENLARGWDLEVFDGPQPTLVEVKGLLNMPLVCEMTPNEYEKMRLPANRRRYVVYVVNNALAEPPGTPVASIFEHAGGDRWCTADGRALLITPKVGAVLSCT